jgi:hypothetical protein
MKLKDFIQSATQKQECLASKCKVLSSNSNTIKKLIKENKRKKILETDFRGKKNHFASKRWWSAH